MTASPWTCVNDGLPFEGTFVLAYDVATEWVFVACRNIRLNGDEWVSDAGDLLIEVTHWMELPSPPGELP